MKILVIGFIILGLIAIFGTIFTVRITVNDVTYDTEYVFSHWNLYRITTTDFSVVLKADKNRVKEAIKNNGKYVEKIF